MESEIKNKLHSEATHEIAAALAKASVNIKHALKQSENPFFKSSYADLKSIVDASRQALADQGLAISQLIDSEQGQLTLITMMLHTSGQWLKSYYPITYEKPNPQAIGSGVTYARRYSLAAICGVVTDDDDGESAMKRDPLQRTQPVQTQKVPSEKEILISKMQNAKTLQELQSIAADAPAEFVNEKFNEYVKQLEAKFIVPAMQEMFQAAETDKTFETIAEKHSRTLKPKGATK